MEEIEKIKNKDSMGLRYFKLLSGFCLYALGIVITINADLGYSPWDVFHQGLSNILHIKIGTANIIVGFTILAIGVYKGQRPGIGTIGNMFFVGNFMNLIMDLDLIPTFSNIYARLLSLFLAMAIMGYASYLYISAAFGAGPRDGLMILIHEKTGRSIRLVRNSMEISALFLGYLLGGPVGIGTVILSLGTGYSVQFMFRLFSFDTRTLDNRDWDDEVESFKRFFK